jgi:transcriptional regulator with XRE-family HTH domain
LNAARYNVVVPENIAKIIKEKCLKQGSVAERAGYTKQQFCDMLNGRKIIKLCDVMVIADALGVGVGDLFVVGQDGE